MDRIVGNRVLEVGVGMGKNLPYYPKGMKVSAIDLSLLMLERAQKRASIINLNVEFIEMDVQNLKFPGHFFDTVFATFVFCSVPEPVLGLRELLRVCKQDGRLLLIEHKERVNSLIDLCL